MYKYAQAKDFDILMIAFSIDGGRVQVFDLASPETGYSATDTDISFTELVLMLLSPDVKKIAYNAQFERVCLAKYLEDPMPPEQWECTMIKGAMLGLPMGLASIGMALKLTQQKDFSGSALIRYFCLPCKGTKANEGRERNLPEHAPEKWSAFINYCKDDVRAEMAIGKKLSFFEIPVREKELWCLDQRINERGVLVDKKLIRQAVLLDAVIKEELTKEAIALTGLDNPNSVQQLMRWLALETGDEITNLRKADVPVLLKKYEDATVSRVLNIRKELAKTSVKKYIAMVNTVCEDGYIRGLFQFAGARTMRWAGRLVQMQNLPKNHLNDLELARELVRDGDKKILEMAFGNIPDTLSQLIRTAFVAPRGQTLAVLDFSAIEARVLAWVAEEVWRLEVFATHGKIYEASAAKMFKVPMESVTKGSDLRQKGKVSELALGYQGGPGALIAMGALDMGLLEADLQGLVDAWRRANPNIVKFWKVCNDAAISAVQGCPVDLPKIGLLFYCAKGYLFIKLPSGRAIAYYNAVLKPGKFGGHSVSYMGVDSVTKKWKEIDSYGGKWTENLVQAIARDCLAEALLGVEALGYSTVAHVHDEVVVPINKDSSESDFEILKKLMSAEMPWAKGLPLQADGYLTDFYKKD